jgi:TonB-linked SusC/RagA family outer membrane protein
MFQGYAQDKNLTGNVTDSDGNPIPGVSITIPETSIGTITDINGNYSLALSPEAKQLQFSFIGMKTQIIKIGSSTVINVVMKGDLIDMAEVVVVGYGVQKKSDITGSVVSVDKEVLESRAGANIEQLLQGSTAGMNITVNASSAEGSSNTMLIRGENSISASNEPLIIFDGIPYSGSLSEINPKDIESIEVLKDASSSAIYGARGSNGVILITSKEGKSGKMTVNYTGSYTINKMINIPALMDGKTFYETKTDRGLSTTTIEDEGYESGRTTDWIDIATQTGEQQQHDLSFRGGNDATKYYISSSYNGSKGIAINDKFNRYLFRINFSQDLLPWITFKTSTQYGYYDRSGVKANFEDAFTMNPLGEAYEEDGSYTMETWEDGVYSANPMNSTLYENSNKTRRFTSNNSINVDFPFIKGLSYTLKTGYDYSSKLNQTYKGTDTYVGNSSDGELTEANEYDEDWIIENLLTYKKEFNKHSIFLTALYSAQEEWSEDHDLSATGFPNDVMTYYQAAYADLVECSTNYTKKNHISQMFRANYAFDSRYLITGTVRRDGYSAFGEDNKFGVFPSVAVGWNLGNENFMQNITPLDVCKLRLSYGINGNEAISAYSTLATLSSTEYVDADDGTLYGFYTSSLANSTLSWEETASFNIGVDLALFSNRLRATVDTYWTRTTDLLLEKSISNVNGTNDIWENIGETKNRGWEIQLSSVNVHKASFKWSSNLSLSHYESEIVNVGLTDDDGNYIDDVDNEWFIGKPIDVNYHYVFDGIYQEDMDDTPQGSVEAGEIKYKDSDGDGTITTDDKQVIGSKIPDISFGLSNTFSYQNFSFSFFLYGVQGITKANDLLYTNDLDLRQNRYNVTFWTEENSSNVYPRNDAHSQINKYSMPFYRKSDFIRLQDISLNYAMPKSILSKLKVDRLEVFANIKNLATWTNWKGLDPEFDDQKAVPQTQTYLMGIKLSL